MDPIRVITQNCVGCNLCVKSCAYDAIALTGPVGAREGKPTAVIDLQKCTLCGSCVEACKRYKAIVITRSTFKGQDVSAVLGHLRVRRAPHGQGGLGRARDHRRRPRAAEGALGARQRHPRRQRREEVHRRAAVPGRGRDLDDRQPRHRRFRRGRAGRAGGADPHGAQARDLPRRRHRGGPLPPAARRGEDPHRAHGGLHGALHRSRHDAAAPDAPGIRREHHGHHPHAEPPPPDGHRPSQGDDPRAEGRPAPRGRWSS